jgi:hypothetical protein
MKCADPGTQAHDSRRKRVNRGYQLLESYRPLTSMQHRQADHFIALVPHDDIVLGQLTVGGVTRLFEVDIEDIRLGIIGRPEIFSWRIFQERNDLQVFLNFDQGHSCILILQYGNSARQKSCNDKAIITELTINHHQLLPVRLCLYS